MYDTSKYMSFLTAPMSVAHTYGNVTAFITEKIKSWFHPEFFKTVNISSTLASQHFNILRNQRGDVFKKEKPFLIIIPRIEDEEGTFLSDTLMTNRFSENVPGYGEGNLFTFIEDKERGLGVKYMINRDKITFDVTIMVENLTQQIHIKKLLRNRILVNKPLGWYANLESQIPREVMAGISFISEIPLTEPAKLIDYCNKHSDSPVTYMLKNSSGNEEYFKYYPAQLDVIINRLQLSDGQKKDLVDDYYAISFSIEVEFFTMGEYYVYTTRQKKLMVETEMRGFLVDDPYLKNPSKASLEIIFTPYEDVGIPVEGGWQYYAESPFRVEPKKPDIVNINSLFNDTMDTLLRYHQKMNIPYDRFVRFYILKDGKLLKESDGDYVIDLESRDIYIYNISILSTYRVVIMVDHLYVKELSTQFMKRK